MTDHKSFPIASFKAVDGAAAGTFEAIVSVFGNVDLVGDRVVKGAFAKSLDQWKATGDPIPVIWSHTWGDPNAHIGYVNPDDAQETDQGLLVKGQLDVDKPFAAQVYDLLNARRVREFSFAYDIGDQKKADDGANELLELDIIEVGPTLKGANPDTVLGDVKSRLKRAAGAKAQVTLDGSLEQRRDMLSSAAREWAVSYRHDDVFMAGIEATFDDRIVVYVESWDEPYGGGTYYELPYTIGESGVELGEPTPVNITGSVQPKSLTSGAHGKQAARDVKEGRRNSTSDADRIQQLHDLSSELGADCASGESSDDGKAVPTPPGPTPGHARNLRALEALELQASA